MKRWITCFLAIGLLLVAVSVNAANEIAYVGSQNLNGGKTRVLTYSMTAAAADGSVTAYPLTTDRFNFIQGYHLRCVAVKAGTNPTALWDITITEAGGRDVMGGALTDLAAAVNGNFAPKVDMTNNLYGSTEAIDSLLTINVSGNSVHSATATIKLYFDAED